MCSSLPALAATTLLTLAVVAPATTAGAKVFHSREEALTLAFPEAERVESKTYVLRPDQVQRIQSISRAELETKLVKLYTGWKDGQVLGYAVIDIHNVRTLPEAFMVVLTPSGHVRSLRLLAFHEPLDYMPGERWYAQFAEKTAAEPLRLGRDVHGIVGATLSARATTRGVRRALAFYEVLVQSES